MTPVEFLTARLDEAAEHAGEYRVAWLTFRNADGSMRYTTVAADHHDDYWVANGRLLAEPAQVEVIYDARGVLADIAAKRAILELHDAVPYYGLDQRGRWLPCTGEPKLWYCGSCQDDDGIINGELPCDTLRILAAPFADHPDYNPAWQL